MELFTPGHLLVLAIVVAVLFFGWKQLPDMARSLGRSLRIFKTEIKGMTEDDKARADAHTDGHTEIRTEVRTETQRAEPTVKPAIAPAAEEASAAPAETPVTTPPGTEHTKPEQR